MTPTTATGSDVYDLGVLDLPHDSPRARPVHQAMAGERGPSAARKREHSSRTARLEPPARGLAATLSLFVPGTGQMLMGEVASGLFFLSSMGLVCAAGWSILSMLERLVATLRLFQMPPEAAVWTLCVLYLAGGTLHVWSVLNAHGPASGSSRVRELHPFWAGLASLLVPGWGQVLNGCRARAGLFLGALWLCGGAWLLVSEPARGVMASVGMGLPIAMGSGWPSSLLLTVPAVVWAIAVYDAASCAAARRRTP